MSAQVSAVAAGSSPLTRGKRRRPDFRRAPARLIPAHAGKTRARRPASHDPSAHPRSRGENDHLDCSAHHELGSSPLTRGKPSTPPVMWYTERLIPAHAGKTHTMMCDGSTLSAHPRSRGENITIRPAGTKRTGSSPLTRGKRLRVHGWRPGHRLIPAHAGKTRRRRSA